MGCGSSAQPRALTLAAQSPISPLAAKTLLQGPVTPKALWGSPQHVSHQASATVEESQDELQGAIAGLTADESQKLKKALGMDASKAATSVTSGQSLLSLIANLRCATVEEVAECLSGVPPTQLKKLEKAAGLKELKTKDAAALKIQSVSRGNAARKGNEQSKATLIFSKVFEDLKGASLDRVAECLAGMPTKEFEKLQRIAGSQGLTLEVKSKARPWPGRGNAGRKENQQSKASPEKGDKAAIAQGLVAAATATADSQPRAAAGLVIMAAAVVEAMPVASHLASVAMGMAVAASAAAEAGSAAAPGLVKAAASCVTAAVEAH